MTQRSRPGPLTQARVEDSARRRRRVLKALDELVRDGQPINVCAVARLAGVHRSLIYRHPDLHAAVQTRADQTPDEPSGAGVTRQSLLTDLANLTERNTRLAQHITVLERRLSETLGEQAWRASGLGAATDNDTLNRENALLKQHVAELENQLADQTDDLQAARATNRELMAQLNQPRRRR